MKVFRNQPGSLLLKVGEGPGKSLQNTKHSRRFMAGVYF